MEEVNIHYGDDCFKRDKDRFYIFQEENNTCFTIASYNVKTDEIRLKNASKNILCDNILKQFIEYSKSKKRNAGGVK